MPDFIDLTGQRFARLTAEAYMGPRQKQWKCRCDCGNETFASGYELKKGKRISCGCVFRANDPDHPRKTHGMKRSPEYMIWVQMKGRCHNPSNKSWKNYGGRGITMCERWRNDFAAFLHDMGPRPGNGHREYSVERLDNNKGYEPDNCTWIPLVEQARNRRNNRLITHEGRTQYLSAWAKESKVSPEHLRGRLRDGWDFGDAIALPAGARKPSLTPEQASRYSFGREKK
jgi:hypothetical protein